jgi:hypothetical protein
LFCKSETLRKGEVQKVGQVCRWLVLPTPTDTGFTGGKLVISGTSYAVEGTHATADNGAAFLYVRLRKWDGKEHVACIGQGIEQCSCEAATYRPQCRCRHLAGLEVALERLEVIERLQWELDCANAALAEAQAAVDEIESIGPPPAADEADRCPLCGDYLYDETQFHTRCALDEQWRAEAV